METVFLELYGDVASTLLEGIVMVTKLQPSNYVATMFCVCRVDRQIDLSSIP